MTVGCSMRVYDRHLYGDRQCGNRATYGRWCRTHRDEGRMQDLRRDLVVAFAEYKNTEGCDCCRNSEGHREAENEIARLLKAPRYQDGSGWDWKAAAEKARKGGR